MCWVLKEVYIVGHIGYLKTIDLKICAYLFDTKILIFIWDRTGHFVFPRKLYF